MIALIQRVSLFDTSKILNSRRFQLTLAAVRK